MYILGSLVYIFYGGINKEVACKLQQAQGILTIQVFLWYKLLKPLNANKPENNVGKNYQQ